MRFFMAAILPGCRRSAKRQCPELSDYGPSDLLECPCPLGAVAMPRGRLRAPKTERPGPRLSKTARRRSLTNYLDDLSE